MSRLGVRRYALGLALLLASGCGSPQPPAETLVAGQPVELDLDTGQSAEFRISLGAGDTIRVRADQRTVDIGLELIGPRRRSLARFDGWNGPDGPEWLVATVEAAGEYRLQIEAYSGRGTATVLIERIGLARSQDLALQQALLATAGADPSTPGTVAVRRLLRESPTLPGLLQARLHWRLGLAQLTSDPSAAAEALKAAIALFDVDGNAWEQAPARNALGDALIRLGAFEEAERVLVAARDLASQVGHLGAEQRAWNNLGVVAASRGDHSGALDAQSRAEKLAGALGDPEARAIVLHNRASSHLHLGQISFGLTAAREALAARAGLGDSFGEGKALALVAWALQIRGAPGDLTEARRLLDRAIDRLGEAKASHDVAVTLEQRAMVWRELGDLDAAFDDLMTAQALSASESLGTLQDAWLRLGFGAVLRERGDLDGAHAELVAALDILERQGNRSGEVAAAVELARTERQRHDLGAAAAAYGTAITAIERSRKRLIVPELRRAFLSGHQTVYEELVDLWADAATRERDAWRADQFARRAFDVAERARARSLADLLMADGASHQPDGAEALALITRRLETRRVLKVELSDRRSIGSPDDATPETEAIARAHAQWVRQAEAERRRAGAEAASGEPLDAETIISHLAGDSTLLAYALGAARSWLFILDSEGIDVVRLGPRRLIEAKARRAHEMLSASDHLDLGSLADATLQDLAATILDARLATTRARWVVVPSGALHLIPFALLPIHDDGRVLDRHMVQHVPSASALIHLSRRRLTRAPAPQLFAAVADPTFRVADARVDGDGPQLVATPRRLLGSGREARRIADLVTEHTGRRPPVFTGVEAHRERLLDGSLSAYRILHLATHGLVDAELPRIAGLVFALVDARGRPRDGLLLVRDLADVQIGADLVVLSACQTALGEAVRGEGVVGLAQGFFAAGAHQLVVSLWEVDDRATAELMERFYRHLLGGDDAATALRRAQRELREETPYSALAHWGAFVVLGDDVQAID